MALSSSGKTKINLMDTYIIFLLNYNTAINSYKDRMLAWRVLMKEAAAILLVHAGLSRKQLFQTKVIHFSTLTHYLFQSRMLKTDTKLSRQGMKFHQVSKLAKLYVCILCRIVDTQGKGARLLSNQMMEQVISWWNPGFWQLSSCFQSPNI